MLVDYSVGLKDSQQQDTGLGHRSNKWTHMGPGATSSMTHGDEEPPKQAEYTEYTTTNPQYSL
jgi:hypothetical protein